jgi:hypothetical protein
VVVVKVLGGYLSGRWSKKRPGKFLVATHSLTRAVDLSLHDAREIVGTVTAVVGRDIVPGPVGVKMVVR